MRDIDRHGGRTISSSHNIIIIGNKSPNSKSNVVEM